MSELLIAAPLRLEALLIRSAARGARVHKTGMGPRAPGRRRAARRRTRATRCSSWASAAGSTRARCPGEVVVAEEVLAATDEGHGPERVACAGDGVARRRARSRSGLPVRAGRIVCVSRLALGERRAELRAGGAIAVDMESVWLAAGAGDRPFGVVRVVLDSPPTSCCARRRRLGRCVRRGRCAMPRRRPSRLGPGD